LYDCCIAAVNGFEDYNQFTQRFSGHSHAHVDYICAESYLQRLWTLQECLLSHTIEFVVGRDSMLRSLTSCSLLISAQITRRSPRCGNRLMEI
jgi:hypothetical protein